MLGRAEASQHSQTPCLLKWINPLQQGSHFPHNIGTASLDGCMLALLRSACNQKTRPTICKSKAEGYGRLSKHEVWTWCSSITDFSNTGQNIHSLVRKTALWSSLLTLILKHSCAKKKKKITYPVRWCFLNFTRKLQSEDFSTWTHCIKLLQFVSQDSLELQSNSQ